MRACPGAQALHGPRLPSSEPRGNRRSGRGAGLPCGRLAVCVPGGRKRGPRRGSRIPVSSREAGCRVAQFTLESCYPETQCGREGFLKVSEADKI